MHSILIIVEFQVSLKYFHLFRIIHYCLGMNKFQFTVVTEKLMFFNIIISVQNFKLDFVFVILKCNLWLTQVKSLANMLVTCLLVLKLLPNIKKARLWVVVSWWNVLQYFRSMITQFIANEIRHAANEFTYMRHLHLLIWWLISFIFILFITIIIKIIIVTIFSVIIIIFSILLTCFLILGKHAWFHL